MVVVGAPAALVGVWHVAGVALEPSAPELGGVLVVEKDTDVTQGVEPLRTNGDGSRRPDGTKRDVTPLPPGATVAQSRPAREAGVDREDVEDTEDVEDVQDEAPGDDRDDSDAGGEDETAESGETD